MFKDVQAITRGYNPRQVAIKISMRFPELIHSLRTSACIWIKCCLPGDRALEAYQF